MTPFGITCRALIHILLITTIFGHSLGPDKCDVPANTSDGDCGYSGIQASECIERGCCWKPCFNCESTTPWCIKSREMFRPECQQKSDGKNECGYSGIHREECLRKGCCWMPSNTLSDPWCYYESDVDVPRSLPLDPVTDVVEFGALRLTQGNKTSAGFLQVYYEGEWGFVCEDNFNMNAVRVACRQMGYSETNYFVSYVGQPYEGPVEIFLDDVKCDGTESRLVHCEHPWYKKHNCLDTETVQLDCDASVGMRLSNGWQGRLEVEFNGEWGTVCDDGFTEREAKFICKKLGHDYENVAIYSERENDDLPIGLDYVKCKNSSARNIFECSHKMWGDNNCGHHEDVHMDCGYVNVGMRLFEGSKGRLEVELNGKWGTVCKHYFGYREAHFVCDKLGYNNDIIRMYKGHARGDLPIGLDDVMCKNSSAKNIFECEHSLWGVHNCNHSDDVFIDCKDGLVSTTPSLFENGDLRLASKNKSSAGFLQVFYDGQWGFVCDSVFNNSNVQVACRQMGYSGKNHVSVNSISIFERGPGEIFLDGVRCSGIESKLIDCHRNDWLDSYCSLAVQIDCDASVGMRLSEGSKGRLEVELNGEWGTVCDDHFTSRETKFVCKKLGYGDESAHRYIGPAVKDLPIVLDDVTCKDNNARNIFECSHLKYGYHNCDHHEDIYIDCGRPDNERSVEELVESLSEDELVELVRELKEIDDA